MKILIKKLLKERLELIVNESNDRTIIKSLSDDIFIHFTSSKFVLDIKKRMALGYEGYSTFAVSAKWGIYNDGAVLPKNAEAAILFKTNKLPKYGYIEEVVWDGIVPLTEAKLITVKKAVDILKKSEANTEIGEFDTVIYQ